MSSTVITGIGELVTCDGTGPDRLGIKRDAAVVIDDDMIAWVGGSSAAPTADALIDVGGRAIIPGFVDSHSHLVFAGDRGPEFAARMMGQPPFTGRSPQAILGAHLAALPEPVTAHRPGLPPGLASMIMRCLEKHAADRPQTAGQLIAVLDNLATPSGGTVPVYAATVPVRASGVSKTLPRGRRAMILVASAAAVGVAAWIWSTRPRTKPAAVKIDATMRNPTARCTGIAWN